MNRELIVNVNPTEISIALCEDKVLVELNKEQCQTGFSVGDIYLGKVRKIMPGLNAAFVNIGHEKDAFIHYLDLGSQFPSLQKLVASQQPGKRGMRVEGMKLEPPVEKTGKIGDYLQVGQNIMVQIAKEAISTKGPRLTSDISLAGRNVVLVPFSSKVFLSQKIRSADEKKRLKRIAAAVLPKNFGVIIRTAAMEAKDEDIEHDIQSQIDRWRKTCAAIKKSTPPAQLMSEMNRANTIIRDSLNGSFSQIAVDDEAMYNDIRNYIRLIEPEKEKIVKLYRGNVPIFDNFDISKQIKSLFAKYVSLRRGAYLIIEHTEAMNVIDVNSGNRTKAEDNQEQTAMDVNLAAAKEIARQLGFNKLDTGAMYRAVTFAALDRGIDLDDEAAIDALAEQIEIRFTNGTGEDTRLTIDGQDASAAIRTPQVDANVSKVSAYPGVRAAMLIHQRRAAEDRDIVAEGRDIGTVVFPNAQVKVFLTADPRERARRRVLQRHQNDAQPLATEQLEAEVDETLDALKQRDKLDSSREVAPLVPAEDAVHVDSTAHTIDEVVRIIEDLINQRR